MFSSQPASNQQAQQAQSGQYKRPSKVVAFFRLIFLSVILAALAFGIFAAMFWYNGAYNDLLSMAHYVYFWIWAPLFIVLIPSIGRSWYFRDLCAQRGISLKEPGMRRKHFYYSFFWSTEGPTYYTATFVNTEGPTRPNI